MIFVFIVEKKKEFAFSGDVVGVTQVPMNKCVVRQRFCFSKSRYKQDFRVFDCKIFLLDILAGYFFFRRCHGISVVKKSVSGCIFCLV